MSAPPAGGDQNRGPALVAIYWAEASFAILAVALRIYGRKLINGFGADDYMMVFTLVRTPFPSYSPCLTILICLLLPPLDPIHHSGCFRDLPRRPRRLPTSLLFDNRSTTLSREVQLDHSSMGDLWLRDRQELSCPADYADSGPE